MSPRSRSLEWSRGRFYRLLLGDEGISSSEFKFLLDEQRPQLLADSKLVRDLVEVWGRHGFAPMADIVKAVEKYVIQPKATPKGNSGAPLKWGNSGNLSAWFTIADAWHRARQKTPGLKLTPFLRQKFRELKGEPWAALTDLKTGKPLLVLRDQGQARNRFANGRAVAEKDGLIKQYFPHLLAAQKPKRKKR